ncbi:receptor for activated c kinase 1 C [Reticulomyxa filosa]|uniref:Receptor for activated c kinase 1 C n=1 Tax=Reticulomyxa filosa TaxID=46433 RepID=X6M1N1_RETFI|nr:receptor for activated c kinase 1 C [Reticulomyxa filosa]|eukprot:ETO08068.1 receptor for activated c kinase 1 C [Reticulomyxa filosa]
MEGETLVNQCTLSGHTSWITSIAVAPDNNTVLTGGRDKTIAVWKLSRGEKKNAKIEGTLMKRLIGHNHIVSAIDISVDGLNVLSSSWDGTIRYFFFFLKNLIIYNIFLFSYNRLWDLQTGDCCRLFKGHKQEVMSCAFSVDNQYVVSGSMDKSIRIWNIKGKMLNSLEGNDGHRDWINCVRFSPDEKDQLMLSCGRDKIVKVWDLKNNIGILKYTLIGHTNCVNSVIVSPDGSLCASGGKDGVIMFWDLLNGKKLASIKADGEINDLCFSPNRYWYITFCIYMICSAVGSSIKIWDLETKEIIGLIKNLEEIKHDQEEKKGKKKHPLPILCTSLKWSHDGKTLFVEFNPKKKKNNLFDLIERTNLKKIFAIFHTFFSPKIYIQYYFIKIRDYQLNMPVCYV